MPILLMFDYSLDMTHKRDTFSHKDAVICQGTQEEKGESGFIAM